jgi:hypothetical protein
MRIVMMNMNIKILKLRLTTNGMIGVAPALLSTYDPEIRIHMLIVHV